MLDAQPTISVGDIHFGNHLPFVLIGGINVLESEQFAVDVAGHYQEVCQRLSIPLVFKASYDKANRTSLSGERGLGIDQGLKVLSDLRKAMGVPVLTDVHNEVQCPLAADAVDVLQIPAFLCRQTDMLLAAGNTGAVINVKKGQFLAPWEMPNIVAKLESTGNKRIMLTERGTSFGYNTLVADMRGLPQMAQTGYPVVMDATHSVQQPGGRGGSSGGQREFAPVMARAAVAVGVAAVFMETHQDPDNAPCDGPNMIYLDQMPNLLSTLMKLDAVVKANPVEI